MNNATTNSFNIINYPEALIITPYPGQSLTISRYFPFQFTTCLYYGNNHQDYNYSYNLYPSLNDSSLIFINEQWSSQGSCTNFTITSNSTGIKNLTLTCTKNNFQISNSTIINITSENIYIYLIWPTVIFMQPQTTADIFSVYVGVRDYLNQWGNCNFWHSYNISLIINPNFVYQEQKWMTTYCNWFYFFNLTIFNPGTYEIIAYGDDTGYSNSINVTIVDYNYSISLIYDSITTVYFNYNISITVYDLQGNFFNGTCFLSINDLYGSKIYGVPSSISTNDTISIYFDTIGNKFLNISCNISDGGLLPMVSQFLNVTVLPEILKIDVDPIVIIIQPNSPNQNFSVTVGIYDNSGSNVETSNKYNGGYPPITLSLTPYSNKYTGSLNGNCSLAPYLGLASFQNLSISTDGSFYITASINTNPNITPVNFPTLINITTQNELSSINIIKNISAPSRYVIEYPISLFTTTRKPYLVQTSISISCNNQKSFNNIIISNGIGTYYLNFTEPNTYNCSISAQNSIITNRTIFMISENNNTNPLCYIYNSVNNCSLCKVNTTISKNICSCIPNSLYNPASNSCECNQGYNFIKNFCALSSYYFSSQELTSNYSADFKSIFINFARPVVQSMTQTNCTDALTLPSWITSYDCVWISSTSLQIQFPNAIYPNISLVNLNPYLIQALVDDGKGNLFNELSVNVGINYPLPTPVAQILGPSVVSLKSLQNQTYSSKFFNPDYSFFWYSTNDLINKSLSGQSNLSNVKLSFSNGSFNGSGTIYLKITSNTFKSSDLANLIIKFTSDTILSVTLTIGTQYAYKPTKPIAIKPQVLNIKEFDSFTYDWKLYPNPQQLDNCFSSSTTDTFIINSFCLVPESSYNLTLNVSGFNSYSINAITGFTYSNIITIGSELVLTLNRSSGTVGTINPFYLSASVSDPDNSSAVIDVSWNYKGQSQSFNKTNSKTLEITTDNLTKEKFYSITATASSTTKSISSTLSIFIDKACTVEIYFSPFNGVVNKDESFLIAPSYNGDAKSFLWIFDPSPESNENIILNKPFLYIPGNYTLAGTTYKITLIVSNSLNVNTSSYTYFTTNTPPVCEDFTATPESEQWTLKGVNCFDPDSNSMVSYQYGYLDDDNSIAWLTVFSYSSQLSFKLSSSITTVLVKVCDDMLCCKLYYQLIQPLSSSTRLLSDSKTLQDFDIYTQDSEKIPSSILYFVPSLTNQADIEYIYSKFINYTTKQVPDRGAFQTYLSSLKTFLKNNNCDPKDPINDLHTEIVEFNSSLTDGEFHTILDIIFTVISKSELNSVIKLLNLVKFNYAQQNISGTSIKKSLNGVNFYLNRFYGNETISPYFNDSIVRIQQANASNEDIVDVFYTQYFAPNPVINWNVWKVGNFKNNQLNVDNLYQSVDNSIEVTIFTSLFNMSNTTNQCLQLINDSWSDQNNCNIIKNDTIQIKLLIKANSGYKVIKSIENLPNVIISSVQNYEIAQVIVMSVIVFVMIISTILFAFIDKDAENPTNTNKILLGYPIKSIFVKQKSPNRMVLVVQIFTTQLLQLTLIRAIYYVYYYSPNSYDWNDFKIGLISFSIAQGFEIPIFILNYNSIIKNNKMYLMTLTICIFVSIICCISIIIITFQLLEKFSINWIISFAIFMFVDVFIFGLFYSWLCSRFIIREEVEENDGNVMRSPNKGLDLTDISNFNGSIHIPNADESFEILPDNNLG